MRITAIGSGYVGLVAGVCFAESDTTLCWWIRIPRGISPLPPANVPFMSCICRNCWRAIADRGSLFQTAWPKRSSSSQAVLVAVGTPPALHWVFTPVPVPITEAFKQPIVTNPLGRFTLHSHCGNSGSYTLVLEGGWYPYPFAAAFIGVKLAIT